MDINSLQRFGDPRPLVPHPVEAKRQLAQDAIQSTLLSFAGMAGKLAGLNVGGHPFDAMRHQGKRLGVVAGEGLGQLGQVVVELGRKFLQHARHKVEIVEAPPLERFDVDDARFGLLEGNVVHAERLSLRNKYANGRRAFFARSRQAVAGEIYVDGLKASKCGIPLTKALSVTIVTTGRPAAASINGAGYVDAVTAASQRAQAGFKAGD
jgi:hypothetical protein